MPPEIQALGEKGRLAYEHALKSGYTKNRRIAIMLIGQSRAGKTSLLKSLKGKNYTLVKAPVRLPYCSRIFLVDKRNRH